MRILLTGGAGYIGSACLRWLLNHGHDAIAYDNLSEGNAPAVPPDRLVVGDILNTGNLTRTMIEHRTEVVIHLAAVASVPESITNPELYYRINVQGTKSVLDAMLVAGAKGIVFSSTAATYGFQAEMPLQETSPQIPVVPYGRSKLAAEWLIQDYARAHGLGYTLLRYFNASGADTDGRNGECRKRETHLIPIIFEVATGRRPELTIYGHELPTRDGTCVRDYIHIEDLAEAHRLAAEALRPGREAAYNMGSGTGTTVLEVLRACEEVVGRPIPHRLADPRPGDPAILIASPERISQELGWKPRYPHIAEIVETAWHWHRSHPRGYVPVVANARKLTGANLLLNPSI